MAWHMACWFDAELVDGIGFSNAPQVGKVADVYGRGFFPFLKPVHLVTGDTIHLTIQATLVDNDYCWQWQTLIYSQGNQKNMIADFNQPDQ